MEKDKSMVCFNNFFSTVCMHQFILPWREVIEDPKDKSMVCFNIFFSTVCMHQFILPWREVTEDPKGRQGSILKVQSYCHI